MKKALVALLVSVLAVSCATTEEEKPRSRAEKSALLGALEVSGPLEELSDAARINVESAALKIVAAGNSVVPAILDDIETNDDPYRQAILVRILARILGRMDPNTAERKEQDALVNAAGNRMLRSSSALDRYTGANLAALPIKSQLVPASLRLLEDSDRDNRRFAALILSDIAQTDFGYDPDAPARERGAALSRWKGWWAKNKSRRVYYSHTAAGNPVVAAFEAEAAAVSMRAGPYALTVTDKSTKAPVQGAVVAYAYHFTSFDGRGRKKQHRSATDGNGKMLLGEEITVTGERYLGAEVIISKAGYRKEALRLMPHIFTANSFTVKVALEPE